MYEAKEGGGLLGHSVGHSHTVPARRRVVSVSDGASSLEPPLFGGCSVEPLGESEEVVDVESPPSDGGDIAGRGVPMGRNIAKFCSLVIESRFHGNSVLYTKNYPSLAHPKQTVTRLPV